MGDQPDAGGFRAALHAAFGEALGAGRVVMTALSAITFLALEAIGGALTLTYGFSYVALAVLLVSLIIFLLSMPIAVTAARNGAGYRSADARGGIWLSGFHRHLADLCFFHLYFLCPRSGDYGDGAEYAVWATAALWLSDRVR